MTVTDIAQFALIAVPPAAWFGVYGLALAATRPWMPDAAPATEDLGTEPPAVVSFVVNRWEVTEDAAESTLLDLAARHYLEFRQPGNDPKQTTVHVRDPNPTGLNAYEQRVFNRVNALAKGGVVPLTALTFRDASQSSAWAKRLTAEVIADARSHGLSRRRFGPRVVSLLTAAAAAAAIGIALTAAYAFAHHHAAGRTSLSGSTVLWIGVVSFGILTSVSGRPHGERDTAAGREVAARWLGVRAWLRGHEAFADLPPAAVTVWDRYLSYGAAVGATRVSSAVIDLGMGNRKRVWSSYAGPSATPSWHRVRVHYPRFWPRYGKTAPRLVLRAIIAAIVGVLLIRYWYHAVGSVFSSVPQASAAASYAALIKGIGLLVGIVALGYGIYAFVRTVIDLAAPRTVTGEVVWQEVWRRTSHGDVSAPVLYYLAVDDGSGDATRAWALPSAMSHLCNNTDVVTIVVRRWSRRVVSATVVSRSPSSQLAQANAGATSGTDDDLIATAMGIPTARSSGAAAGPLAGLIGSLVTPAGPLLTADEVGAALGLPVTLRDRRSPNSPVPVEISEFTGADGSVVLTVMHSGGLIARMAMRRDSRQSEAIAGVGDEARGGPGWVAARRGEDVLLLRLGRTVRATPP
ncbi:MAG TPA: hypothetical protein VH442_03775, partial [Micromonosporaceae bacterium]